MDAADDIKRNFNQLRSYVYLEFPFNAKKNLINK